MAVLTAGILAVIGVGAASAQAGSTPPELGDPIGDNVSPHGGYDASTTYCVQCHTMHGEEGSYILMAEQSVTATCATCHGLEGVAAGGARAGTGTASARPAYVLTNPTSGHATGATVIPGETSKNITDSPGGRLPSSPATRTAPARAGASGVAAGGLYCASCHTPHGDKGHLVNDWAPPVGVPGEPSFDAKDEGKQIQIASSPSAARPSLDWDGAAGAWRWCTAAQGSVVPGAGANEACPWAMLTDARGESAYAYGYKLLSAAPNHTYANATQTYTAGGSITNWCASCHESKPRSYTASGGTTVTNTANHGSNCASCHGTATTSGDDPPGDYPHTSSENKLLKDASDALCINCHTGRLS